MKIYQRNIESKFTKSPKLHLVGIGAGPSNLALGIAVKEFDMTKGSINCINKNKKRKIEICRNSIILEKNDSFIWNKSMLLPNARLQVPFLRDLVSMRNPQSYYSFINYLKEMDLLEDFINLRTFFPTRYEFSEYMKWVSNQLGSLIQYDSKVTNFYPVLNRKKEVEAISIEYIDRKSGVTNCIQSSNVALAIGKEPYIPDIYVDINPPYVTHSCNFLDSLSKNFTDVDDSHKFMIVGSGQSAGEIALYLLQTYKNSSIHWHINAYTLHGTDSSNYINKEYHHSSVSEFYKYTDDIKLDILNETKNSNYGVIDSETLSAIASIEYQCMIDKNKKIFIYKKSNIINVFSIGEKIMVDYIDILKNNCSDCFSGIILATGYKRKNLNKILSKFDPYLIKNNNGEYVLKENYEIESEEKMKAKFFLQGDFEEVYGPSNATLSVVSYRAEKIIQSLILRN